MILISNFVLFITNLIIRSNCQARQNSTNVPNLLMNSASFGFPSEYVHFVCILADLTTVKLSFVMKQQYYSLTFNAASHSLSNFLSERFSLMGMYLVLSMNSCI